MSSIEAAERDKTKHVVYALMYGAGKNRLSELLETSPDKGCLFILISWFLHSGGLIKKMISDTINDSFFSQLKSWLGVDIKTIISILSKIKSLYLRYILVKFNQHEKL